MKMDDPTTLAPPAVAGASPEVYQQIGHLIDWRQSREREAPTVRDVAEITGRIVIGEQSPGAIRGGAVEHRERSAVRTGRRRAGEFRRRIIGADLI